MSPTLILCVLIGYFGLLLWIAYGIGKKNHSNEAFFSANRNSKWYLVAFGMIGTALSGVTFISVPGEVGSPNGEQFKYFQFVLGNAIGFVLVATVLLPLYYRLNLVSIYTYIEQRLGYYSYKTAAGLFLLGRTIGSAFRLYLVVMVLQRFVFDAFGVPFAVTVLLSLLLIFAYTYKGGLKTIIITDTLQTFFLIGSVLLTLYFITQSLGLGWVETFETIKESGYSKIFFWDNFVTNKYHFVKQILGGIFITLAVVGLDQDLMQKNLSCSNIKEAQKNMFSFTAIFVLINLFFLSLGALLYVYAERNGISVPLDMVSHKPRTDLLFPEIALNHLSLIPGIVFLLGLTAATFATTDSALTALTTSFCVDFLNFDKPNNTFGNKVHIRHWVHIGFSLLMFGVILLFNAFNDASVVSMIFKIASYTYGPLLGLYAFGILFKNRMVLDKAVPWIAILAPLVTFYLVQHSRTFFGNYVFDNELIIINGGITLLALLAVSRKQKTE